MSKLWVGILLAVCTGSSVAAADQPIPVQPVLGRQLGEWSLADHRGKSWSQQDFADKPVLVMAFWGVECPLAQLYASTLQKLADDYASRGVAVVLLDPNRHDSLTEMGAFARRQGLTLPFVKDLQNQLADRLGAARTPEVFVLDATRTVKYHGRIDDQHAIGGHSRVAPTRRDLQSAVEDLLAGRPVEVAETEAVGCLIGRVKPAQEQAKVTFAEHVAPLLQARCVECHREGEIGPFSLSDYEEVAGWAPMIAEVTRERRMPPWHADPQHGEFVNENRLTDAEIELLQDWARAGAPAGDLTKLPEPRKFTEGWQLPREPDVVIAMGDKPYQVPAAGEVRYQYFSVDPGFKEDKWVTAAEVVPGARSVVHHVIVFAAPGGKVTDDDGQMLMAYVPGMRVIPLKPGYAKRIPAGSKFIFQMHYTPNGTPQEDLTKIGLIFADPESVKYEVQTASTRSRDFEIQPRLADQSFTSQGVQAPVDLEIISLMPHMHLRGQSFRYEITWPDGKTETLLNVPNYDFNWQMGYRFHKPLAVPQGAKLVAYAEFDNSTGNLANPDPSQTVRWGDQSWEEMLIGYFDIAIPRGEGGAGNVARAVRVQPVAEDIAKGFIKRLDKNSDGELQRTEVQGQPKLEAAFVKVDENRDDVVTLDELVRNLAKLRQRN